MNRKEIEYQGESGQSQPENQIVLELPEKLYQLALLLKITKGEWSLKVMGGVWGITSEGVKHRVKRLGELLGIGEGNIDGQIERIVALVRQDKVSFREKEKKGKWIYFKEKEGTLLTRRELEVFGLVGLGLSNSQIAKELEISSQTVKNYVTEIFVKFGGVKNRLQAIAKGISLGLINLESLLDEDYDLSRYTLLSDREREVLAAMAETTCLKKADESLHISHHTGKNHRTRIYRELGVHTHIQAVIGYWVAKERKII